MPKSVFLIKKTCNHQKILRKKFQRQNFGEKTFGEVFQYFGHIFQTKLKVAHLVHLYKEKRNNSDFRIHE